MSWYKAGTVAVTAASATVIGSGTSFIANVKLGELFQLEGGSIHYEVVDVVSNTEITIDPPYLGTTQTAQAYRIVPVKGFPQRAYDAMTGAMTQWNSYLGGALSGLFGDGAAGASGIGFQNAPGTGWFRKGNGDMAGQREGTELLALETGQVRVKKLVGDAVQSSLADATPGLLALVGSFGWGVTQFLTLPGDDLDATTIPSGSYRAVGSLMAGTFPPGATFYGTVLVERYETGTIVQTANRITSPFERSRRVCLAGVWQPWAMAYDQSTILGTVSQSGGTPTGAIIESGSNANGDYLRFGDGTQICTNDNAAITTAPAAFVGTITKIDGDKLWLGRWF